MFIRRNNTCIWSGNCQGYGDGVNQIYTTTYNASPIYTTLSANISAADVTIGLTDATSFANSGTIRIAEEQITYSGKSGNNLTGCTRGTGGTTAKIHRAGCYLEKYVVYTSPEANSSISTNGLMEMTLTYRDVRDESTLELIASNELLNRMDPIERMTLIPNDPIATTENIQTGDLIKITDAESSISGNYRVVTIIYENNYGVLDVSMEASNKSLTFIEQMQKEREKNQSLQKYMQGATNIYSVNVQENCDSTHYLNMRFYIPAGVLAINDVSTNFKLKDFRAYETTGTTANTVGSQIAASGTTGDSITSTFGTFTTICSFTTANIDCEGCFIYGTISILSTTDLSGGYVFLQGRITDGSSYYPDSTGSTLLAGALWNDGGFWTASISQFIPGNQKNKTFSFQLKDASNAHTWVLDTSMYYTTFSRHTHDINFGIYEESLVNPSVDVYAGVDGSETLVGTYTSDQTNLDVTANIPSSGGWYNIQFRPNQEMRIEGNAYIKCFIEST